MRILNNTGEEITAQMYDFVDKDGVEVALRPEMTPSLARLALRRAHSLQLPLKWFSIPQCWRFEHTVRGRKREHYQWNVDIIGVTSVVAEVELLHIITSFFGRVGIGSKDVGIKINSRKVLGSVLASFGVSADLFAPTCVVIDKLDKIGPEEVIKQLISLGLTPESASKIIKCLSVRSIEALEELCLEKSVDDASRRESSNDGNDSDSAELLESIMELKEVFKLAECYGFQDWLIFDASVVRYKMESIIS